MSSAVRIERATPGSPPPDGFEALAHLSGGPPDAGEALDASRWVAFRSGGAVARVASRRVEGLAGADGPSGLLGHYEALDAEAGVELLREAARHLIEEGARRVLGPMNGSTWKRYRLALPPEPGDRPFDPPWFAGEPRNPLDYPDHFEAAGFAIDARYESRIDPSIPRSAGDTAILDRAARAGVRLRTLAADRFDDELHGMFELSLGAFAGNLYYTPIEWDEFRAMYAAVRPYVDPELVMLAETDDGGLRGYLFGYPDPPGRPTRSIAKTLAVDPAARGRGIGGILTDAFRDATARRGLSAVVHALMHVSNVSKGISDRRGTEIFRRYALYRWPP